MNENDAARAALTRRGVLRTGAALALGGYGLHPTRGVAADVAMEFDGSKFQLAAPEPNPKYGGTLRIGLTSRQPHFDLHQSGVRWRRPLTARFD